MDCVFSQDSINKNAAFRLVSLTPLHTSPTQQVRLLATPSKLHILKFLQRLPEFQYTAIPRSDSPIESQLATVTISHADVRTAPLLDMHLLRLHCEKAKRHVCAITTKGTFLLIQPKGRVMLSTPLTSSTESLSTASIVPVTSQNGFTKRLFITLEPGKVAMLTREQLSRLGASRSLDSDFSIFSLDTLADSLCWTRINTVFDSREVLIVSHNARFAISQYALPKEDESPEVGLRDVIRAGISSVASRWFARGTPTRALPTSSPLRLLSTISDPKRTFDNIIAINDLTATIDKAGRVWVLDSNSFIIIRMLKGYRGGDIAWHQTATHINLAVYLPSRQLLDVWRMRTGLRTTRMRLPEQGRLLSWQGKAYFLTESGRLLLFDQSEAGIHPSYFYDNSADPLTSSARFQRDRELVGAYTSNKNAQTLSAISVENIGMLLPFLFGESNRGGEEYLDLVTVAIEKVEGLLTHPNKLVLFKTIKADSSATTELASVETLLGALHQKKKICRAYCEILKGMREGIDALLSSAPSNTEVQKFLEGFNLAVQFDDEFEDAHGEGDYDKLTFENAIYFTSWRQFFRTCTGEPSEESSHNLSLIVVQLLLCSCDVFEKVLKRIGKNRGAAVEMFFTWVSYCDVKQLALAVSHPSSISQWLSAILPDYTPQLQQFIGECPRLCGVYLLLKLCVELEPGSTHWQEEMRDLTMIRGVVEVFAERGVTPQLTLRGITRSFSISRAVAQWELTESEAARVFGLNETRDAHIEEQLKPLLPESLLGQLNHNYYAIHRADITLSASSTQSGFSVSTAFQHLASVKDPLLYSAALLFLYRRHIAKSLLEAFEDLPGVSDLPIAVSPWLNALEANYQREGSFMSIEEDEVLLRMSSTWLDANPVVLGFNLQQMRKVMLLSGLTSEDMPSVSALTEKLFVLTSNQVEELVHLNLPVQAIDTDADTTTKLFKSLSVSRKEDARVLSSILTTDEESLKILSIKRLLEEGSDTDAEQLILEVQDTLKLSETLYAVARKRIAYVVQVLNEDPKYALLISNFPRKLITVLKEDTHTMQPVSPLAAKDLLSRAIKYMDEKSSVNYAQALELESAFQSFYKLATAAGG